MEYQTGGRVTAVSAFGQRMALPVMPAEGTGTTVSFADSLIDVVRTTDARGRDAEDRMAAVDSGQSDDLVGAMLASQEASLSFSLLMQVRNKVVGAVDELIKLQL